MGSLIENITLRSTVAEAESGKAKQVIFSGIAAKKMFTENVYLRVF